MVLASPSILSSTSSFSSNSNAYSDSSSYTCLFPKIRPLNFSARSLRYPNSFGLPPLKKVLASSSVQSLEDGSAEQFLQNNSIADFMRFKRGVDGDSGKLQTAVVSYKKKFPWLLFRPFLQVLAPYFVLTLQRVFLFLGRLVLDFYLMGFGFYLMLCRLIWFRQFTSPIKSMFGYIS